MTSTNKARSLRKNQTDAERLLWQKLNFDQIAYDNKRSDFLKQRGFKIFRFWNNDVFKNTEGVMESIRLMILKFRTEKD